MSAADDALGDDAREGRRRARWALDSDTWRGDVSNVDACTCERCSKLLDVAGAICWHVVDDDPPAYLYKLNGRTIAVYDELSATTWCRECLS